MTTLDQFTREGFADMTDDEIRSEIEHYRNESERNDISETAREFAIADFDLYSALLEDRA